MNGPEEKFLADLTDKERKDIEDGNAMAIPVRNPSMGGMFFAASAGLIVAAMITMTMIPLSMWMVECALLSSLLWLCIYKIQSHVVAGVVTENRVLRGLIALMVNKEREQEVSKGTKRDETCLSTVDDDDKPAT